MVSFRKNIKKLLQRVCIKNSKYEKHTQDLFNVKEPEPVRETGPKPRTSTVESKTADKPMSPVSTI